MTLPSFQAQDNSTISKRDKVNLKRIIALSAIILSLFIASCGGGSSSEKSDTDDSGGNGTATPAPGVPTPTPTPFGQKVWTISEILAEPSTGGGGGAARCGGEFGFRRCICAGDVPSYVRYRPAVVECNGNAAAILSGRLLNAFSVVVRDTQNKDRWPEAGSGYGGCSFEVANAESPPNSCSAFKAQDRFYIGGGVAEIYCFGESGYSEIFADAARLTVKLTDDPNSSEDEIERFCLHGATLPLN